MKKLLLFALLFIVCGCVYGNDFIKLNDGRYVLTVSVDTFEADKPAWKGLKHIGNTDGVLVVFDKNKKIVKKVVFGGKGEECVNSIIQAYGSFYVLGTVWEDSFGTGDFKNLKSKGKRDWFVAKFNKNFKLEKIVSFGSRHYDFGEDIVVCKNGLAVVGRTYLEDDNSEYAFITLLDKNLKMTNTQTFKGSSKKPGDALATSFQSVVVNDKGNFVCVGDVTLSEFIDVPGYGIVVEFDKNLKIVNKKSVKKGSSSVIFSGIVQDEYYYLAGYVVDFEVSHSYFVVMDKNLNVVKSQVYIPKSNDKENPVYCSFDKIFAKPNMVFGFGGKYKGNGDYDDDFYHNYGIPYSEKGLDLNKTVKLPKDSYTYLVEKNKISALIFSREKGEEFKIVDVKL